MIKMLTACTYELDDIDLAVSEILEGLDLQGNQLKNACGVINCYSEFIDTGVVKAVCDALPFDVIGCTSLSCSISGETDMMALTVSVLTSDDVSFTTVVTDSLSEGMDSIAPSYERAAASLPEPPKMILAFFPLIMQIGGEILMDALDAACGGVPIFGTTCCDHLEDYRTSAVFCNGEAYRDAIVMILMNGAVNPKFFVASIPDRKLQKQGAVITKSKDTFLMGVNGEPVFDYLKGIGLSTTTGAIEGMNSIPFLVDYRDGSKAVARAMYLMTDEGIVCGGAMPEGAVLTIGSMDSEDVLETAKAAAEVIASEQGTCAMLFPCLSRIMALGADTDVEFDTIKQCLGDMPYQSCYSGGEICPVYDQDGRPLNRFHNFTMAGCVFC